MKNFKFYQTDFGAPPPPPPPPGNPPPPPPPAMNTGSGFTPSTGGSASTNSIIALVAGILAYVMCPLILGVVAWIMGKGEIGKINRGASAEAGRSMATIGMWLGIVNTVLFILAIVVALLFMILGYIAHLSN